jgi:Lamin Tail Domain
VRLLYAALALCSVIALVPASATPACAQSPLRLNEILPGPATDWNGSGSFSSRDDEWIELWNADAATIDLTGYLVTDGDSLPRIALSGTLGPNAHRLIFGRESFEWEQANGFPAFGLSLGNSGDTVMLWKITGADTALVDSYTYRSHEAAADRAIGRLPDGGTWALFDGLNPYTGSTPPPGNGCSPSPGTSNHCDQTPARAITWGEVKTRYR